MKILIIPNNTSNNCYGLRNKLPAKYLEKLGHEIRIQNEFKSYYNPKLGTSALDPIDIDWADVVVFNRHYDMEAETIGNLIEYAKQNGKKVVYETDDLIQGLDSVNPMYASIKGSISQVQMMIRMADLVTTTGEFIKQELSNLNDNVHVLYNSIEKGAWKLRKGRNKTVKVGWAGGSSHIADLMLIVDVVKDLQKEIDFEFHIFGLSPVSWKEYIKRMKEKHEKQIEENPGAKPAEWYQATLDLNEKLKQIKWIHHPFVPLEEYNKKLSSLNLDIGLCPLVETRFNKCKSAIKFYEYAMVGTTTLASKVTPYKEEVNYVAKNQHGKWKAKLRRLIEDKKLRKDLLKEQREFVLKNRDIERTVLKWELIYKGRV